MKPSEKFTLVCLAPDGQCIREGTFETVQAAWDRSSDMGSRWFFYPVHLVTGPSRGLRAKVLAAPDGCEHWEGLTLGRIKRAFAVNSETVCAWCNGEAGPWFDV